MLYEVGASITVHNPTEAVRSMARERLTFANPDYISAERMGRWLGNTPKHLRMYVESPNAIVIPYGMAKELKALGWDAEWESHLTFKAGRWRRRPGWELYPYQDEAVSAMAKKEGGVLEASCGSGKTQMGLAVAERTGGRTLWLTHTKELLKQSEERFKSLYEWAEGDIGEITEGRVSIGSTITFATVQTLSKADPRSYADAFSTVVVDECHHCAGTPTRMGMFYKALSNIAARCKYGLSATLTRQDGLMGCVFALLGPISHTIPPSATEATTVKASIEMVHLPEAPKETLWATLGPDGMMDYQALLRTLCESEGRTEAIAERAYALAKEGRRQLILTHRVDHAKKVRDALEAKGVRCSLCVGATPKGKRDWDADAIIATYALAKEGLDIPTLDTVHLTLPTKDESTLIQSAGRAERRKEGKKDPIIEIYVDVGIPYCERACQKMRRCLQKGGRKAKEIQWKSE